jgi:ATPase subunit of ABC transporter with duplicated ATPase domains
MLQPADLLILDEPTNDLDIPTLDVLEDSLVEFPGALMLVTHDRWLLDRVSTMLLALDGTGRAEWFADYAQWESAQERAAAEQTRAMTSRPSKASRSESESPAKLQWKIPPSPPTQQRYKKDPRRWTQPAQPQNGSITAGPSSRENKQSRQVRPNPNTCGSSGFSGLSGLFRSSR